MGLDAPLAHIDPGEASERVLICDAQTKHHFDFLHAEDIRVVGPTGGGWLVRHSHASKRLQPLRNAGWSIVPCGENHSLVSPPA